MELPPAPHAPTPSASAAPAANCAIALAGALAGTLASSALTRFVTTAVRQALDIAAIADLRCAQIAFNRIDAGAVKIYTRQQPRCVR